VLLDLHLDLVGIRKEQAHTPAEREGEIVDRLGVEGIRNQKIDLLAFGAQRHHAVVAGELAGDRGDGFARELHGHIPEKIIPEVVRDPAQETFASR
jgi:hypothetical protein